MIAMTTIKLNRAMREAEKFLDIAHRYLAPKNSKSVCTTRKIFEYDDYSKTTF